MFKEMPNCFIVSNRYDLLINKKLFGKAILLELRAYSKYEVRQISPLTNLPGVLQERP